MNKGRPPKITKGKLINAYYETGSVEDACLKLNICEKTFYNSMDRLRLEFSPRRIIEKSA